MALNKNTLKNNISATAKNAANKAYLAAMNVKIPIGDLISGNGIVAYSENLKIEQAKKFAEIFDKEFSEKMADHIDEFVKSGDVAINDINQIFATAVPVASDGGAAILAAFKIAAEVYIRKNKNGKIV